MCKLDTNLFSQTNFDPATYSAPVVDTALFWNWEHQEIAPDPKKENEMKGTDFSIRSVADFVMQIKLNFTIDKGNWRNSWQFFAFVEN